MSLRMCWHEYYRKYAYDQIESLISSDCYLAREKKKENARSDVDVSSNLWSLVCMIWSSSPSLVQLHWSFPTVPIDHSPRPRHRTCKPRRSTVRWWKSIRSSRWQTACSELKFGNHKPDDRRYCNRHPLLRPRSKANVQNLCPWSFVTLTRHDEQVWSWWSRNR